MNPIYLTEDDVRALLDVPTCIGLLEDATRSRRAGRAMNAPRQRVRSGTTMLHVLAASLDEHLGHKSYTAAARGPRFLVTLYGESGELLALIEADALGRIRTGAASGLATKYLARDDARTLACIGTGTQARTQIEAVCAVRPIERVLVAARDRERVERFCAELRAENIPADPATSADEAIAHADVVCTITTARTPVFSGSALRRGTHVNAAGSNRLTAQEIDVDTVARAGVVVVEDAAQAPMESGDLTAAVEAGRFSWDALQLIDEVVAGNVTRAGSDVTLFESLGIGLWDVAAARYVHARARCSGRGVPLSEVPA